MSIAERGTPRASPDETSTRRGPDEPAWPALRALLLRLHFYAGVLIGPFLLVAAVTGIAYVFTPQLERAVYDHELHVPAGDTRLSLDEQAGIAAALVPDGRLTGVRPGPTPTDSTQVIFTLPDQRESYHQTVFVDPHTGEVRGQHETYGSGQALPLRGWIDNLHRNLHLGEFGRLYSELAASWLWVVVLAGLALWIGRRRKNKRELVLPQPGPAGRRRTLSWHGAVGLWAAAGLLFLSATGLTWSAHAGATIGEVRTALDWTTPAVTSAITPAEGPAIGLQAARDAALAVGLTDPVEVRPPAEGKAYVVQQVQRSWPEKQDSASIHPVTGEVLDVLRFADHPLAAKLTRWGIDAHMGLLFGLPNQLVLTALALALVALVCWGYRMWWQRRPTRGGARFGRAPARGGWRRTPGRVLAPLVVAAVVVGYYLPLLGVPLLGFLALDVALGARRARQEGTQEGTQAEAGPGARADDGVPDEGTATTEEQGVPA